MQDRTPVKVDFAQPSDRTAILGLLEACDLPVEDLDGSSRVVFMVARDSSAVVGCVGVELSGGDALLRSLAVRPQSRDAGIGHSLVEAAEDTCRRNGVRNVYLLTITAENYFSGRGYERLTRDKAPAGISSTSEFSSICPASSAFMTKHL